MSAVPAATPRPRPTLPIGTPVVAAVGSQWVRGAVWSVSTFREGVVYTIRHGASGQLSRVLATRVSAR